MKKRFVIFLSIVLLWSCSNDNPTNIDEKEIEFEIEFENDSECLAQHFYYTTSIDDKVLLDAILLPNKILVGFEKSTPNSEIVKFINQYSTFEKIDDSKIQLEYWYDYKMVIIKTRTNKTCSELHGIINALKNKPIVSFASYTYRSFFFLQEGQIWFDVMSYTDEFLVQVFDANDLTDLNEIVAQTNAVIKEPLSASLGIFLVAVTKNSKYDNPLKMSQYFFETGKLKYSYPNFWNLFDKD